MARNFNWRLAALTIPAAAVLVACGGGGGDADSSAFEAIKAHIAAPAFGSPQPVHPNSFAGIAPTWVNADNTSGGNAGAICLAELTRVGASVTGDLYGIKVDGFGPLHDDFVVTSISSNNSYLAWSTGNATMQAVLMKGGNGYNIYNYAGSGLATDSWLASPLNNGGNVPEISHYHVCYTLDPTTGQGCTPGYWRNHMDRWTTYVPSQAFNSVFTASSLTATLGDVVSNPQTYGAFQFHAVAALLNSTHADVSYQHTTAQVIAMVNAAITANTKAAMNATKNDLAAANEAGCPLGGTRANRDQN